MIEHIVDTKMHPCCIVTLNIFIMAVAFALQAVHDTVDL